MQDLFLMGWCRYIGNLLKLLLADFLSFSIYFIVVCIPWFVHKWYPFSYNFFCKKPLGKHKKKFEIYSIFHILS